MKYKITFTPDAWEDFEYWDMQDKKSIKKIRMLIKELQRHPEIGEGHPEMLKDNLSGLWSRHIDQKNRMIYEIGDGCVTLIQLRTHYSEN